MNNSNDGCFGKRFVKVYFNVLHQRLACELPPARVTAAFSVKEGKKTKKKHASLVWRTGLFVW